MQQMARILGRKELALALGVPAGKMPAELTAEQRVSLARLVDGRIDDLVRGCWRRRQRVTMSLIPAPPSATLSIG